MVYEFNCGIAPTNLNVRGSLIIARRSRNTCVCVFRALRVSQLFQCKGKLFIKVLPWIYRGKKKLLSNIVHIFILPVCHWFPYFNTISPPLILTSPQFVANWTPSAYTTSQTLSGRGMQPFISARLLIILPAPTGHVEQPCLSSRGPQRSPHSGTWPAAALCSPSVASWWQLSVWWTRTSSRPFTQHKWRLS